MAQSGKSISGYKQKLSTLAAFQPSTKLMHILAFKNSTPVTTGP